jgi:hypothetical protein
MKGSHVNGRSSLFLPDGNWLSVPDAPQTLMTSFWQCA